MRWDGSARSLLIFRWVSDDSCSLHGQRDFYLHSVGSHKRVGAQSTPGGLLLGRLVPLNCYMWFLALFITIVKAPSLILPPPSPSLYKTYRKTLLKGLAWGLWCHDNSSNYRWFPAFDTVHRALRTAAEKSPRKPDGLGLKQNKGVGGGRKRVKKKTFSHLTTLDFMMCLWRAAILNASG